MRHNPNCILNAVFKEKTRCNLYFYCFEHLLQGLLVTFLPKLFMEIFLWIIIANRRQWPVHYLINDKSLAFFLIRQKQSFLAKYAKSNIKTNFSIYSQIVRERFWQKLLADKHDVHNNPDAKILCSLLNANSFKKLL